MYTVLTVLASAALASAATYKASFTEYGSTDTWGSGNCNVNTAACGFYTYVSTTPSPSPKFPQLILTPLQPGYSAAVSQNVFGVGPGAGAGPGCGTCWKLTIETDSSGNAVSNAGNSIIVQVNNLCPGKTLFLYVM